MLRSLRERLRRDVERDVMANATRRVAVDRVEVSPEERFDRRRVVSASSHVRVLARTTAESSRFRASCEK